MKAPENMTKWNLTKAAEHPKSDMGLFVYLTPINKMRS